MTNFVIKTLLCGIIEIRKYPTKKGKKAMKKQETMTTDKTEKKNVRNYRKDAPGAVSGINTPGIELPAFNPPVPNRAWTAMKNGMDIDQLTEAEKADLYLGHDKLF